MILPLNRFTLPLLQGRRSGLAHVEKAHYDKTQTEVPAGTGREAGEAGTHSIPKARITDLARSIK